MGLGDDVGAGGGQAVSCWGLTMSPGLPPGGTHGAAGGSLAGQAGGVFPFCMSLCGFSDTGSGRWSAGIPGLLVPRVLFSDL